MKEYRHGAHSVFEIHVVWVTKYRRKVLIGDVGSRVREIIREICRNEEVEIISGHVSKDHIHLYLSMPPQVTISRLIQRLIGKSSYKLLQWFESLRKQYRERHLWARRYFCYSNGNVTDEAIKVYIGESKNRQKVNSK